MGVNIYPPSPNKVTFGGSQQPVYLTQTADVIVLEKASSIFSTKFSLINNNTAQNLVILSDPSNRLIVHSISISNHLFGSANDQLGVSVHSSATGVAVSNSNAIANSYEAKGTSVFNYDSGLKLPAGVNLYYRFDYNGTSMSVNGFITIVYSEVSP